MLVLVVDDDPEICEIVRLQLEQSNLNCSIANNSDQALQILSQEKVNLVVTDLDMPGKVESLLAEIRTQFGYEIPVYVFTGDQRFDETKLLKLGADRIYSKPSSVRSIVNDIKNYLSDVS